MCTPEESRNRTLTVETYEERVNLACQKDSYYSSRSTSLVLQKKNETSTLLQEYRGNQVNQANQKDAHCSSRTIYLVLQKTKRNKTKQTLHLQCRNITRSRQLAVPQRLTVLQYCKKILNKQKTYSRNINRTRQQGLPQRLVLLQQNNVLVFQKKKTTN